MISCETIYDSIKGLKFIRNGYIGTIVQVNRCVSIDMIELVFVDLNSSTSYWREQYSTQFIENNNGKDFYEQLYRNHHFFHNRLFRLIS